MLDINTWIKEYKKVLHENFGQRVWFIGLQGSYGRGEATEASDIDVVVILDKLDASDIENYSNMLDTLSHREKICGFLSGKNEIMNWETSDLFQFYYDTKPIKGSLDVLLSRISISEIERGIKIGISNIYHGCVHNMLYEKNIEILRGLYKSASFVIQAIDFKQSGKYTSNLNELIEKVNQQDRDILENFMEIKAERNMDFKKLSDNIFSWSKSKILYNY